MIKHAKWQKSQSEEREQASEPDLDMADILKLSALEFNYMLRPSMVKGTTCKNRWVM